MNQLIFFVVFFLVRVFGFFFRRTGIYSRGTCLVFSGYNCLGPWFLQVRYIK